MRKSRRRLPSKELHSRRAIWAAMESLERRTMMTGTIGPVPYSSVTVVEDPSVAGGSGVYADGNYAPVVSGVTGATGTYAYDAFSVVEFDPTGAADPVFGDSNYSNIELSLTYSSANKYNPEGGFDVFILPLSTTAAPTANFAFQSSSSNDSFPVGNDVSGLNGQGGAGLNYPNTLLGTFTVPSSSNVSSSYNLSNYAADSGSSAAVATLTSQLANGTPVRLALTPANTSSAMRFYGPAGSNGPSLSVVANAAVNESEQFTVNNSAVTVDETSGQVLVDVTRTGYSTDPATVNYTASGGTAVAGTNYTSPTGTVNFAAGQTQAYVSIPIVDVSPQGGNLNFNVTLSSPADQNPAGDGITVNATLGSQVTTQVTIVDAAPLTNNATSLANSVTDIETSGPYTGTYAPVVGSSSDGGGSFGYQAFEVLEFSPATTPSVFPGLGYNVSSLSNLTVSLYNTQAVGNGNEYAALPGDFQIYLLTNSETTTPTSGLAFTGSAPPDGVGTQGAPALLGTFSFSGAAGYATYTPASLAATTAGLIVSDLDTQTPFRLAVAPGSTGFAADFQGGNTGNAPILSLTDTTSLVGNPETVGFNTSSAPFSVNESAGSITLEVDRSDVPGGNLNDQETVNYTTSNGTALAGTNYNLSSGTLTFGPNVTSKLINIPIDDAPNQGGDKIFTVTLSGPASNVSSTQATLGTSSVNVTVVDSTTGTRETLISNSSDQQTLEPTGPYNTAAGYVYVTGNTSTGSTTPSYVAADFNDPDLSGDADAGGQNQGTDVFAPSATVTQIDGLTIGIVGSGKGVAGPVNVYLVTDATTNIDPNTTLATQVPNPHNFSSSAIDSNGVENGFGTQFGTPMLLGQIQYSLSLPTNAYTQVPLIGYSQATENTLIGYINNNTKFRLILAPGNSSVDADIQGNYDDDGTTTVEPSSATGGVDGSAFAGDSGKYSPTLSIAVNEGTVSSLPSYLSPTSQATYNSSNNTLTVTGPTTFIADPGAASAPLVVASGSGATISFNTSSGSQLHLAGLNLSNGATAAENNPTSDPIVLEIASGLSIDSTSTLDIGTGDVDVSGGNLAAVTALVARGYNLTGGANWKGTGITSSAAAASSTHLTAVGVIANTVNGTTPIYTTFDGDNSAQAGDILLKYTYVGDANLSGNVDGSDYSLIDAGYSADKKTAGSATGWYSGDFNYDGTVDGSDYALIDNAFNNQKTAITFSPSAVVASDVAPISAASVSTAPAASVSRIVGPAIPATPGAHTVALPVARFVPPLFSTTPITTGTDTGTQKKAKRDLADSVADLIGKETA